MKKKNYEKPQVEIIEVKQADIICTSTTSTAEDLQDGGIIDWFNYEEE